MKLGELASVQMGYSFRSRLERTDDGNICVIQMKDIGDDGRIRTEDLLPVVLPDVKEHHLVQAQDLVFRSRGQTTTAAVMDRPIGPAVVASPLLRIRVLSDAVYPAYLCWFINQPTTQVYFVQHAEGTSVRMVSKTAVEELDIAVPPLDRQRKIIKVAELAAKEQELIQQLAEKRKLYIEASLMGFASGN